MTDTRPAAITEIHLSAAATHMIAREASRSADGLETGGILLGALEDGVAQVRQAGEPGPAAVRTPRFFLRDLGHAQRLADSAFRRNGSLWIGEWHTHPGGPDIPSPHDLNTYAQLLSDDELRFHTIVAVIVTAPADTWNQPLATGWTYSSAGLHAVPLRSLDHQ